MSDLTPSEICKIWMDQAKNDYKKNLARYAREAQISFINPWLKANGYSLTVDGYIWRVRDKKGAPVEVPHDIYVVLTTAGHVNIPLFMLMENWSPKAEDAKEETPSASIKVLLENQRTIVRSLYAQRQYDLGNKIDEMIDELREELDALKPL